MNYYCIEGVLCASMTALDFPEVAPPKEGEALVYLTHLPCQENRAKFRVTHPAQLVSSGESVAWLDPKRLPLAPPLPVEVLTRISKGTLSAVNYNHPRWRELLSPIAKPTGKLRVHLVAVGDVGGTFATGLKLLGGDCIETIGLFDLNPASVERWVQELGQVNYCDGNPAMPTVESVTGTALFDCDVLVFAATKTIPAVGSDIADVRMAQLGANRELIAHYGKLAREAHFGGLFMVLSDPVDPLCRKVYEASNQGEDGQWDGMGLLPEQVQGFGLGVMQARAMYYAKEAGIEQLDAVRSFGPHGQGLVVANSLDAYDHALSEALTIQVITANLKIRELGYKPYVAPALSSGAFQLLCALRGQYHESSVCLGGIWFGARNRFTPYGVEVMTQTIPDALYQRLVETQAQLYNIG
ncbi:lactate dehydrogenase [Bengtsoniella intestinalis]|uniref:lactate dehydrogenase n=1 Tax=Bengtsoniella intestinalis TaxID=3073143 RepID=UPI00391F15CD